MTKDPYRFFRIEARELLEGLSEGALGVERGEGKDLVARMLRQAHTLKGAARVVKQPTIAELAHTIEETLAPHRDALGSVPRETVDELLRQIDRIAAALSLLDRPAAPSPEQPSASDRRFESVRVDVAEIDSLLDSIVEAGAQVSALRELASSVDGARRLAVLLSDRLASERGGERRRLGDVADELRRALEALGRGFATRLERVDRELASLRQSADAVRLVPVGIIFGDLDRAVRDAALALDRHVRFEGRGGELRLDAHVIAGVRDAFLHLVRNAVAHGIEPAARRAATGKPAIGRVLVTVERNGSDVAFACHDDGAGIDLDAVRRVVIERGLVPAVRARELDGAGLIELLMAGGVSTAAGVNQVAGRGVGLDVVRDIAARLKGRVTVASTLGAGTTMTMTLPASLSSLDTLEVEVGGVVVSLPLTAVERTARLTRKDVKRSGDSVSVLIDGAVLPFVALGPVLRVSTKEPRATSAAAVVRGREANVAIGVDRIVGTGTVIVRPLPALAAADHVVAGARLDAQGRPQLVLDPDRLVDIARRGGVGVDERPVRSRPPVLVIDDSLTTRMLEQSILESAGYEVDVAVSAEEALEKAARRRYGVFLVDVEMPGMSGFEFVERTRADADLRSVPSILVTSLDSKEDRRRGEAVGAHAYIVKSEFDQGKLLALIRGLVG